MTSWKEFFDSFKGKEAAPLPGALMINFVNRYLDGMEGVKYKIEFEGQEKCGVTTTDKYSVQIDPKTISPIKVYAWSRRTRGYKLIDTVVPKIG